MIFLRRTARRRPDSQRRVRIGAVSEQRAHCPVVAAHDGFVEGGESRSGGVGIRAVVEQKLDQFGKAGMRGQHQCAHAPRVLILHVGAG